MAYGTVEPMRYENVTVVFIDFSGFTASSLTVDPQKLVKALEFYFENFDRIIHAKGLERIKTIGDGYMYAGGVMDTGMDSALICVSAALEIRDFVLKSAEEIHKNYGINWKARFGIHTGPIVAGVIGKTRLAYDIWGETVNFAKLLETQAEPNQIIISFSTFEKIKDQFTCRPLGKIPIKKKMGLPELSIEAHVVESMLN